MIAPANAAASTTLTVTTSASTSRYGLLMPDLIGPCALLLALALFCLVVARGGKTSKRSRFAADGHGSVDDCRSGARNRRLRRIRRQHAAKPRVLLQS